MRPSTSAFSQVLDIAGAQDIGLHTARFRGVHDDKSDAPDSPIVLDRHEQLLDAIGVR